MTVGGDKEVTDHIYREIGSGCFKMKPMAHVDS